MTKNESVSAVGSKSKWCMFTKAIQELSAEEYEMCVDLSRDEDKARARSLKSLSIVQGTLFGCLDNEGSFMLI